MRLESQSVKKALLSFLFLLPVSLILLSCAGTPNPGTGASGLPYRAFISNSVSAGTIGAGIFIVDAIHDVRANASPITAGNSPGMMVVTPNRAYTLVFSGTGTQSSDNLFSIINNATEQNVAHQTLPGMTESFVAAPDSSVAYVAIPTAPVVGQSPGLVEVTSLTTGSFTGEAPVPAVHFLSINNSGSRLLGFSDNSDQIAVITPSLIGIGNAVNYIGGTGVFDRPVAAFFSSDDSTAYIVSCGAECGGMQASVQQYNLVTNTLVQSLPACVPLPNSNTQSCAGSVALVVGSTMYLAGTPFSAGGGPSLLCSVGPAATQATNCGQLTIIDLDTNGVAGSEMTVTNTTPIVITDGYHNRIAMAANGQLFIGARNCTEIIPQDPPPVGAEVRGCLSIYNSLNTAWAGLPSGGVLIAPETGDATGIQPIATRDVVYVIQGQNVQGGTLYIYSTETDALQSVQITNLIGGFIDVKTVDF
jgi:hypothetical protein